jgi:hypothetical protein
MIDTFRPPPSTHRQPPRAAVPGPGSCLARELRELAHDLAGRLDRDAVDRAEERVIDDAIEAAVIAVLPAITGLLEEELSPRLEALPLHARLALADTRRHRELGVD